MLGSAFVVIIRVLALPLTRINSCVVYCENKWTVYEALMGVYLQEAKYP